MPQFADLKIMLWTDKLFVTSADLARMDSEAVDVARAEGVVLEGPNGLIRAAYEELTDEFQKMMISFGGYLGSGDVSPNHLAAVLNVGLGNAVRQKALPSQVVVSGDVLGQWNHVKRWAVYYTLELLYRDSYNRTVKDRYEGKMRYYKSERQRRIEPTVRAKGVPIVTQPLQRPAAAYEPNVGSWGTSNVGTLAAGGATGGTFDVVITYCKVAPGLYTSWTRDGNAESSPSERIVKIVSADFALSVNIGGLNPPTGVQLQSQVLLCVITPMAATHWNVYAGVSGGTLYLQNLSPIPLSTSSYDFTEDPVINNFPMREGQVVDRYLSLVPTRQRA